MRSFELFDFLDRRFPFDLAEEWDNSGLIVGDDRPIDAVYIALDATDEVIDRCIESGCGLLLTHHPLIFSGLYSVSTLDFTGRRALKLARNGVCYIAAHTNYDICRMSQLAAEMIGLDNTVPLLPAGATDEDRSAESGSLGIGCVGALSQPFKLRELAGQVGTAFDAQGIHVFGEPDKTVERAALLPGSGKSGVDRALEAGADVLITGDIDHHAGIDAEAQGLAVIDAGHYGLEHIFVDDIAALLNREFPELKVVTDDPKGPFFTV